MTEPPAPSVSDTPTPYVRERSKLAYVPSLYTALVLFLLTVVALYLLIELEFLLVILFLAVLVASGVAGPVRRLERHGVPRPLAILLVYAVIFATFAAIVWYVLPRLVAQVITIAEDLPGQIEQARELQRRVDELSRDYPVVRDLSDQLRDLAYEAGDVVTAWLLEAPQAVATAVFALVSVFTIAFLLLTTKERLLEMVLSLFHPRLRATTKLVLDEMGERLGAYLRAKVIVMVIVGALVFVTLFLLGSPYAVLAAIFAGGMEALPKIGPWFGRVAIALAMVPLGWEMVAVAIGAHVVIENLKGLLLAPLIEADQVDIHPLTAFIAVIAGGLLLGWLGALIAVPAAAVLQVLIQDVIIPWRRAQLAAAEQAYVIGPPAPEVDVDVDVVEPPAPAVGAPPPAGRTTPPPPRPSPAPTARPRPRTEGEAPAD